MKKSTSVFLFLLIIVVGLFISGCLENTDEYGTVRYDGVIYPIGDAKTVTRENLSPNIYYPFFKNSFNSSDGYYFVNGNGQVFESLENDYRSHPIELTPYELEEGSFDWDEWIELRDCGYFN
ncbi:hypothetical protein [Methanolapillus millepedarum]|uniref:Uncharacterized protein n=1 Tax=Methanolapillus millepedarum TaxID=3028296 RepID=A0AA96V158_9EURY|nr:hypothetical protein MsAc7_00140 [Methanosarcinaceae archaeon Ac7]